MLKQTLTGNCSLVITQGNSPLLSTMGILGMKTLSPLLVPVNTSHSSTFSWTPLTSILVPFTRPEDRFTAALQGSQPSPPGYGQGNLLASWS